MPKPAAKPVEEQVELDVAPVVEAVTYVPGPMDPAHVVWCGYTFHANVPKEIRGHAAGTDREKMNAHLIERARENKFFRVGNAKPKRNASDDPTTAEQYRAYFAEWLKLPSFEHVDELIARLSKDRELWQVCGVGTDDFDYMGALFMPRLHEFAKRDEMNDTQLSSVWVRYGFNQLPWQMG